VVRAFAQSPELVPRSLVQALVGDVEVAMDYPSNKFQWFVADAQQLLLQAIRGRKKLRMKSLRIGKC
jgi:hypothetical protein